MQKNKNPKNNKDNWKNLRSEVFKVYNKMLLFFDNCDYLSITSEQCIFHISKHINNKLIIKIHKHFIPHSLGVDKKWIPKLKTFIECSSKEVLNKLSNVDSNLLKKEIKNYQQNPEISIQLNKISLKLNAWQSFLKEWIETVISREQSNNFFEKIFYNKINWNFEKIDKFAGNLILLHLNHEKNRWIAFELGLDKNQNILTTKKECIIYAFLKSIKSNKIKINGKIQNQYKQLTRNASTKIIYNSFNYKK